MVIWILMGNQDNEEMELTMTMIQSQPGSYDLITSNGIVMSKMGLGISEHPQEHVQEGTHYFHRICNSFIDHVDLKKHLGKYSFKDHPRFVTFK